MNLNQQRRFLVLDFMFDDSSTHTTMVAMDFPSNNVQEMLARILAISHYSKSLHLLADDVRADLMTAHEIYTYDESACSWISEDEYGRTTIVALDAMEVDRCTFTPAT